MTKQIHRIIIAILLLLAGDNMQAQLSESFEGAAFPPTGWTQFDNGIGSSFFNWNTTSTAQNGSIAAASPNYGTPGAEDWLVTPMVAITASQYNLTFWERKAYSFATNSAYAVLVSSGSQTTASSFTQVAAYSTLTTSYAQRTINLSAYIGQSLYIAFMYKTPASGSSAGWYVDNVATVGACTGVPTGLAVSALSTTSANVGWTGAQSGSNYLVRWQKAGTTNTLVATTNSCTITGLQGSQTYSVAVRQICSPGDTSGWSSPLSLIAGNCSPAAGLALAGIATTSAQASWIGNGTSYYVKYGPGDGSTPAITTTLAASPSNLTGLNAGTNYSVAVRSYCATGDTSNWSSIVNFNTQCNPLTVPWFDSLETSASNTFPICWNLASGSNVGVSANSFGIGPHNGSQYLEASFPWNTEIFTPALSLNAGTGYRASFWYAYQDYLAMYPGDSIYLMVNTQPNASGAIRLGIVKPFSNTAYELMQAAYVAPVSGTYYFGIGINGGAFVGLDDFAVVEDISRSATVSYPCGSAAGSATLHITGGLPPYTVLWPNGAATQTVTGLAAGTYIYTITDALGTSVTGSVNVVAAPNLTVSAITTTSLICAGTTATLTASGAGSYAWSGGQTTASIFVTPSTTTSYTVTGTSNGCQATAMVTQSVSPNPTVSATTTNSLICAGTTVTLTASGAGSYAWSGGQSAASISVTPSATTNYTVTGTSNGCQSSAVVTQSVSVCTGIEALENEAWASLYPNPNDGVVTVQVKSASGEATISIYDAVGRLVLKQALRAGSTTITTGKLDAGVYIYRIDHGGKPFQTGRMVRL